MTSKRETGRANLLSRAANAATERTRRHLLAHWEIYFFLTAFALLSLQVYLFNADIHALSGRHGAIALFADFEVFVAKRLAYMCAPAIVFPLAFLLFCGAQPSWHRRYLDILGWYLILRMAIQLIGLNILVFDSVTPRFLLITQLLFFLPYSLSVWGWIYWRLDMIARSSNRLFFRLDCEGDQPRPIDYFVASFSSVFSATISGIKGNSARARILILAHGFVIYDIMGLTLSRAIALVQSH